MKLRPLGKSYHTIVQSRASPISLGALAATLILIAVALVASTATKFSVTTLPNIFPLIGGVLAADVLLRLAPQQKFTDAAQLALYAILYLVINCVCGVIAAYSLQRMAFPLQDQFLARADAMLGFEWLGFARWVDDHPQIQGAFHLAYDTIFPQIVLPVVVFAFADRLAELRVYLLALALAFILTIVISALMPAVGPIVFADPASFKIMRFTGATPIDQLRWLREAGPMVLRQDPGGIATFPSFHATIAILIPLTLRKFPRIFTALLVLDAAMLGGTLSEGAHYLVDVLAGGGMALFAYATARPILRAEARLFSKRNQRATSAAAPVPI